MPSRLKQLFARFDETELLYDNQQNENDPDNDALGDEQDEIFKTVFHIIRDNMDAFESIRQALDSALEVISATYGRDENGELDPDCESEYSGADIVEMLEGIEIGISEAAEAANQLFGDGAEEATDTPASE